MPSPLECCACLLRDLSAFPVVHRALGLREQDQGDTSTRAFRTTMEAIRIPRNPLDYQSRSRIPVLGPHQRSGTSSDNSCLRMLARTSRVMAQKTETTQLLKSNFQIRFASSFAYASSNSNICEEDCSNAEIQD